jgi:hypothetical protein
MIGRHVFGGQLDAFYAPAPAQDTKITESIGFDSPDLSSLLGSNAHRDQT